MAEAKRYGVIKKNLFSFKSLFIAIGIISFRNEKVD